MNCDTMKKLLPAWLLNDLDVEQRREVESHAGDCASCRVERDGLKRTNERLAALPEVETSAGRRHDVVAAMRREHDALVERALLRPRRPIGWMVPAAAAAVLMVVIGLASGSPFGDGPVYRIASDSRGHVVRASGPLALERGLVLRRGDSLLAESDVRLEGRDVVLELKGGTQLSVVANGILLERGSTVIEIRRGETVVRDLNNDYIALRPGRFEVDTVMKAGTVMSHRGEEPKTESALRLKAKVIQGAARLAGPKGELELIAGEVGELDVKGSPSRY